MKIGLVCPYDMYKGGGVQEYVLALADELSRRGHMVKIISPLPRKRSDTPPKNVLFIGEARDFKSLGTTTQVSRSDRREVDSMLANENFDILHFHEPWVPIVSRQILARSPARNVATFHAMLPQNATGRTIERIAVPYTKSIFKYLDALTAVSDAAAKYVRTLTKRPIIMIPDGIELEKYRVKRLESRVKGTKLRAQIFYVGRLEKRKGVKYLLQAFALLKKNNPHATLVIAGKGPDRAKLELLAADLKLGKAVKFLGFVNDSDKIRLLHAADLFCSPAVFGESFGIVLLEAMAAGVPTVAGDNPGYAEVMTGRGRLSLVNPKDTNDFARRLALLLEDEPLRELWREWASNHVEQFSYPRVVDAYEKLYTSL